MNDRLTHASQEALQSGQTLATSSGHAEYSPLHLLAALTADSRSAASSALERAGIDPRRVHEVARAELKRLPTVAGTQPRPGQAIGSFFAFPQNYRGGLTLTVQDYNNDGKLDILAGTAGGKNPQVRVFNGRTFRQIDSFFASVGGFAGPISLG
jgi:hypothetical protein